MPLFAVDDNTPEMGKQGKCIWTRTPLHKMKHCYDHLLYVAEDDLVVYKNSYSWAVCGELRRGHVVVSSAPPTLAGGHYMVPLEGGGSVAWKWLRPALRADLGLDPGLYVDDLSSGIPKLHRRLGMYKHVARWLAFCCLVLRAERADDTDNRQLPSTSLHSGGHLLGGGSSEREENATTTAAQTRRPRLRRKQAPACTGSRDVKQPPQPANEEMDTLQAQAELVPLPDHTQGSAPDSSCSTHDSHDERGTFPNATNTTCYLASTLQCLHSSSSWAALVQKSRVQDTCAATHCGWCLLRHFEAITRKPGSCTDLKAFAAFFNNSVMDARGRVAWQFYERQHDPAEALDALFKDAAQRSDHQGEPLAETLSAAMGVTVREALWTIGSCSCDQDYSATSHDYQHLIFTIPLAGLLERRVASSGELTLLHLIDQMSDPEKGIIVDRPPCSICGKAVDNCKTYLSYIPSLWCCWPSIALVSQYQTTLGLQAGRKVKVKSFARLVVVSAASKVANCAPG